MTGLIVWVILTIITGIMISKKTTSKIIIFGGGFIASLLILMILTPFFTQKPPPAPIRKEQGQDVKPNQSESVQTKPNTASSDLLEYNLAIINAGGYVSEDHITVSRFRSLLDQLSSTYRENKQQIADMSVKAQELLKEEGVKESLLNIMEGLNQLFAIKTENKKFPNPEYSDSLSVYATLRRKGQSHSEAIRGIQSILQLAGAAAADGKAGCVSAYDKAVIAAKDADRSIQKGDMCGAANGLEIALNWLGTAENKCAGDSSKLKDVLALRDFLRPAFAKCIISCGH